MRTNIAVLLFVILQIFLSTTFAASSGEIVDPITAKELHDRGALFVDTRSSSEYQSARIPGAVLADVRKENFKSELAKVAKKGQEIVFYCRGRGCTRSHDAARIAKGLGFDNFYIFAEGFPGWKSAGYPLEN